MELPVPDHTVFRMEPLFGHQAYYLEHHYDQTAFGLWWEMGTAKTRAILENARMLNTLGRCTGVLVVAPNGVHLNWRREAAKYLPGVPVLCYTAKWPASQHRMLNEFVQPAEQRLRILSINVEAFSFKNAQIIPWVRKFLTAFPCMFVIDESTIIANPKAQRTKTILALGPLAKFRRELAGNVTGDNPFACWSQLEFLVRGASGLNYFQFQHEYGVHEQVFLGNRSFKKVVGYRRLDRLKEILERHGSFVAKSECLDLPPKMYVEREVELSDDQRKVYNLVRAEISFEIGGGRIEPINAMAKLQQLHNIVVGFVKDDNDNITWLSESRFEALVELLKEINAKTIIWCCSRPALAKLAEVLSREFGPESFVEYHGGIKTDVRDQNVDTFQNKPECRFFVANQQAAGHGLTLTAATYEVYFRNDYSLEDRLQSEDRAHRAGQTNAVTIVDMVAPFTVDRHVINALLNKQDIAGSIVEFLKRAIVDD